jgi:Uma2 family endonuclease
MAAPQPRLVTVEELEALPEDAGRFELIDGVLVPMSPTIRAHARAVIRIGQILLNYIDDHPLGEVQGGDPGMILRRRPDTVLAPDVCFIAGERLDDVPSPGFQRLVPDLVVEVLSPSDRPGAVAAKTQRWLAAGARLVWNVDPEAVEVVAFVPGEEPRVYGEDDLLPGEPVLPGFSARVRDLLA